MKNVLKKAISIILVTLMVFGSTPLAGFVGLDLPSFGEIFGVKAEAATYSGTCGDTVNWSFDSSTGTLDIIGTGAMTDWTTYDDVPWYSINADIKTVTISNGVTSVGDYAFYRYVNLTSVSLPDSIMRIGYYAFEGCKNLTDISLPNSITNIGSYAFSFCNAITSVTLPENLTRISKGLFYNCDALLNVVIPEGITEIADYAFSDCDKLVSIDLPESLTTIGNYTFSECDLLSSLHIPKNVSSIGEHLFNYSRSISKITVDEDNLWYSADGMGVLFDKDKTSLILYPEGNPRKSYTVPSFVTTICKGAFLDCYNIINLTIPYGVTRLNNYSFYNCDNISTITIPDSLTYIGENVFSNSNKVSDIYFSGNKMELDGLLLVNSLRSDCWSTATIHYNYEYPTLASGTCGDTVNWSFDSSTGTLDIIGSGSMYYWNTTTTPPWEQYKNSIKSVYIGEEIINIGDYAFYKYTNLKEVVFSDDLIKIGKHAFSNCTALDNVTLPDSVLYIDEYAFRGCSNLNNITLSNCLETIGNYAFADCPYSSILIPDTVTSFGEYVFSSCGNLTEITIPSSVTSLSNYMFKDCVSLENVIIPDSVTSIGKYCFYGCNSLTDIPDFNSVTSIYSYAFSNCEGLVDIIIPNSVKYIYAAAFEECANLEKVFIPDSVTYIDNYAFADCYSLSDIRLSNKISYIGTYAFSNCDSLTSIQLPSSLSTISACTFKYCENLKEVIIDKKTTSIKDSAFLGCDNITDVYYTGTEEEWLAITVGSSNEDLLNSRMHFNYVIEDANIIIGGCGTKLVWTFNNETGELLICGKGAMTNWSSSSDVPWYNYFAEITKIIIDSGVTSLGNYAFYGCSELTELIIPVSVTSIGSSAFTTAESFNNFYYTGDITDWCNISFSSAYSNPINFAHNFYADGSLIEGEIVISYGVTSIGQYVFYGFDALTDVSIPDSVLTIGQYAFAYCENLENIEIPDSVTSIGTNAFSYCKSLINATLGNGVTTIGNYAFYYCESLVSINIGSNVTSVTNYAFEKCSNLVSITVDENNTAYSSDERGVLFNKDKTELIKYPDGNPETHYTVPESVVTITARSFRYNINLKNVVISEGVTDIMIHAFSDCASLEEIYIPSSVIDIYIPGNNIFNVIGAFYNCNNLKRITVSSENNRYSSDEYGVLYNKFKTELICYPAGKTAAQYIVPENVTTLSAASFYNNDYIEKIVILGRITTVTSGAFKSCSNLKYLVLPSSVTKFENYSFNGAKITDVYFCGTESQWSNITKNTLSNFPSSANIHYNYVYTVNTSSNFCGENLTWSFNESNGTLTISGTGYMTDWASSDTVPWAEFKDSINRVIIEEGVISVGEYAFNGCDALTTVVIPTTLTRTDDYAFSDCPNFIDVYYSGNEYLWSQINKYSNAEIFENITIRYNTTIPEGKCGENLTWYINESTQTLFVTGTGATYDWASPSHTPWYNHRDSVKHLVVESGVTYVGTNSFSGLTSLETLTASNSVKKVANDAFGDSTNHLTIYYQGTATQRDNIDITISGNHFLYNNVTIYFSNVQVTWNTDGDTTVVYGNPGDAIVLPPEPAKDGYIFEGWTPEIPEVMPEYDLVFTALWKEDTCVRDTCGENVNWIFDRATGILIVRGEGEMAKWSSVEETPWYAYKDLIKQVIVEDGVTNIYHYSFSECSSLESVTLGKDITNIGMDAFKNCVMLAEITIHEGVTSIGNNAFYGCESLKSIIIPDSVTQLGQCLFSGCTSLESVSLPSGLETISYMMFYECSSLTDVVFPDSVITIDTAAFQNCTSLENINIPENVNKINFSAFMGCSSLKSVIIPDSVCQMDEWIFKDCTSLETVVIGNGITDIKHWTFYNCTSLKNVTLGNSLSVIGESAFESCCSLESIVIPDTTNEIGYNAFSGCTSLTDVNLGNGLQYINNNAFYGCSLLNNITIPDSVISIGHSAFYDCDSLTEIVIPDSVTGLGNSVFSSCSSLESISIGDGVTVLEPDLLMGCTSLKNIYIGKGLKTLKRGSANETVFNRLDSLESITVDDANTAFYSDEYGALFNKSKKLLIKYPTKNSRTEYTVPDTVTKIEDYAFCYGESLTNITFPNGLTEIGNNAFFRCSAISTVTIPTTLKTIGYGAFSLWNSLTDVYYKGTRTMWSKIDFGNYGNEPLINANIHFAQTQITWIVDDNKTVVYGEQGDAIVVPASPSKKDYVFVGWTPEIPEVMPDDDLVFTAVWRDAITINGSCGENVTWAFDEKTGSLVVSGTGAMTDWDYSSQAPWNNYASNIKEVIICNGVTSVGNHAFYNCTALEEIVIPDSVTSIGDCAFFNCSVLMDVELPDSVTSIGESAFDGCCSLVDITLSNGLTSIGQSAFNGCYILERLVIPDSVTEIGDYAFSFCWTLSEITIPISVTYIGEGVFDFCDLLVDVYYQGTRELWNKIEINSIGNDPLLYATIHYASFRVFWIIDGEKTVTVCKPGNTIVTPVVPEKDGFEFAGWNPAVPETMPAEDITFTATWKAKGYIITWVVDGIETQTVVPYGETITVPENPTKEGHTFVEWVPEIPETMPTNDLTFTANFNINSYYVTWIVDGAATVNNVQYGQPIIPPANPTKDGFKFVGWTPAVPATMPGYDMAFVAVWDTDYIVDFTFDSADVEIGGVTQLEVVISPEPVGTLEIKWSSSDESIAMVDENGLVMGVSCGSAIISAEYDGKTAFVTVNVPHPYTSETTDATCTQNGFTTYTCSFCGDVYTDNFVEAKGHSYIETVVESSCTGTGYTKYECKDCGDTYTDNETPAAGHKYDAIVIKPTCTTDGYTINMCSACGMAYKSDAVNALGHNYTEKIVEATCISGGYTLHTCLNCGDSYQDNIVEYGSHNYVLTTVVNPTCSNDGYTEYTCTHCNGKKTNNIIEATGHKFTSVTNSATCTNSGYTISTCDVCGFAKIENQTESLGHEYITEVVPATCVSGGYTRYTCIRGDHVYISDETEAVGHNYEATEIKTTCIQNGCVLNICLNCGRVSKSDATQAYGHSFNNWVIVTSAGDNTEGLQTRNCKNCGYTEEKIIPMLQRTTYTATFVADGIVVSYVEFLKDATSLIEPEVPQKHRYSGKWEEYTLTNADITINAEYTLIDLDDLSGIDFNKSASYNSTTGEATINLYAASEAKTMISQSSKKVPLDIVLVVDQSGSMAEKFGGKVSKQEALIESANDFVNSVYADASANGVDHRIAVVGFGMGNKSNGFEYPAYLNTEILTTGGSPVNMKDAKSSDYASALMSVNNNGSINSDIVNAINSIDAKGATAADFGLSMACNVFANNADADGRQRIVVFMTDGEPTYNSGFEVNVGNAAVQQAYQLKNTYDAYVYSVGIFDETKAGENLIKFMNHVSSNCKDARSAPGNFDMDSDKFFVTVDNTDVISEIFTEIIVENITRTTDFDNITLIDTVSKYFTLTSQQEKALRISAIEKFGVKNSDITVTRNADGTTTIEIKSIHPEEIGDKFVVELDFNVSANENASVAGNYVTNTEDAGIIVGDAENYECIFSAPEVNIPADRNTVVFTVNDEIYAIKSVAPNGEITAPETDFIGDYKFTGWNIPAGAVANQPKSMFNATLVNQECVVIWNTDNGTQTVTYAPGDVIDVPDVAPDKTGMAFRRWNNEIPVTMPAESIEFTAVYGDHEHKYTAEVIKAVTCLEDGETKYTCSVCEGSYTESVKCAGEHSWKAITGPADKDGHTPETFKCEACGISDDRILEYMLLDDDNGNIQQEFNYVDENGNNCQPDGELTISVPLDGYENAEAINVYRVNDDGTKTQCDSRYEDGILEFDTDHFSTYIFEPVYQCIIQGKHPDSNDDGKCDICRKWLGVTVTWVVDDNETKVKEMPGEVLAIPATPVKEGFTFIGWTPAVPETVPDTDVTYTAVFRVNTYTVKWVVDGKEITETYEYGSEITVPVRPEKDGYFFVGWTPAVPSKMPAKDMTFIAKFADYDVSKIKVTIATPGTRTVQYRDSITLYATATNLPEGARIKWSADNNCVTIKSSNEGKYCTVTSKSNGNVVVTAYIVDANGDAITNEKGVRISDSEGITSEVTFWSLILYMFKQMFAGNPFLKFIFRDLFN